MKRYHLTFTFHNPFEYRLVQCLEAGNTGSSKLVWNIIQNGDCVLIGRYVLSVFTDVEIKVFVSFESVWVFENDDSELYHRFPQSIKNFKDKSKTRSF